MRLALGKMGMRPADFWGMTWIEFQCAAEGFAEFHGGKKAGGGAHISRAELDDLMKRGRATLMKQGLA